MLIELIAFMVFGLISHRASKAEREFILGFWIMIRQKRSM
jgi:hypothetical protein